MPFRKYSGGGPVVSRPMLSMVVLKSVWIHWERISLLRLYSKNSKIRRIKTREMVFRPTKKEREEKHQAPLSTKGKVERDI